MKNIYCTDFTDLNHYDFFFNKNYIRCSLKIAHLPWVDTLLRAISSDREIKKTNETTAAHKKPKTIAVYMHLDELYSTNREMAKCINRVINTRGKCRRLGGLGRRRPTK